MHDAQLKVGHTGKFLPPYSPMFNPIEELFSKFKSVVKHNLRLRRNELIVTPSDISITENRRRLLTDIAITALAEATPLECNNWDRHMFSFIEPALAYSDL